MLRTLTPLPAQLAAVQQQLAELTQRLAQPPVTASHAHVGKARVRSLTSVPAPARSRPAAALAPKQLRPPAHVLPLVEYVKEGHYVVICPKHGLLSLQPDTPAWFAWLAQHASFRFVGRTGRLTAHREIDRLPRGCLARASQDPQSHLQSPPGSDGGPNDHRLGASGGRSSVSPAVAALFWASGWAYLLLHSHKCHCSVKVGFNPERAPQAIWPMNDVRSCNIR